MSADTKVDFRENDVNWEMLNVFAGSVRADIIEEGLKIVKSSKVSLKSKDDCFKIKAGKFIATEVGKDIKYVFEEEGKETTKTYCKQSRTLNRENRG